MTTWSIRIPQAGTQSVATFLEWTVRVGDHVQAGETIASVETEKAVVALEAEVSGTIADLIAKPQDEVEVATVLGSIDEDVSLVAVEGTAPRGDAGKEVAADLVPLSRARVSAAENLLWVSQHTARASTTVEIDFEAVAKLRTQKLEIIADEQKSALTYLPFVAFAAVRALLKYPEAASRLDLEANVMTLPRHIDLGIAVSRSRDLLVPVVRNAESLALSELAEQIAGAAQKVRDGTAKSSDLQGSNFTITNPGVFGSVMSAPIVNRGEASILCIDAIEKRAVVVDDAVAVRRRAFLTLAFDHRIVDGNLALKVLNEIKFQLERCDSVFFSADFDRQSAMLQGERT